MLVAIVVLTTVGAGEATKPLVLASQGSFFVGGETKALPPAPPGGRGGFGGGDITVNPILMGHSESGFFPEQAALIDPSGVKGIISIEMPCVTTLSKAQISVLAKIPSLMMFGEIRRYVFEGTRRRWLRFEEIFFATGFGAGGGGSALPVKNS